jgi:hypothetical protein
MGAIRFRHVSGLKGVATFCLTTGLTVAVADPPLREAPVVWYDDDKRDIPQPASRDPNLMRDALEASFFRPIGRLVNPGRLVRNLGTAFGADHVPPAVNVNTLDEVPNSSWFTNRIGLFPMTAGEAARGPMTVQGPDRSQSWTVISAKTEGVTPGFNIRDAGGDVYVIKFDPPGYSGMATAAGVISGRILHTAGYNVPEDVVVTFRRDELVLAGDVELTLPNGTRRAMTTADLEQILEDVGVSPDGTWRALASKFLKGTPVGPFDWRGTRHDDPNDRVRHEDRRELRGFRMFAAWLCHFDTKQGNTLDMYVEEGGRRFVRHYFIDFASTLGAGALGPFPTACYEYSFDFAAMLERAVALGLNEDPWRRLELPPGLDEVGYFESEIFDPMAFKPLKPNAAFANFTRRDGYWAAKIISAFTDQHLEAIVAEGRYRNPDAARWIAQVLGERRDEIARYWFDVVPPLDFFTYESRFVRFHDLGAERGLYPDMAALYRARVAAATPERRRGRWTDWMELAGQAVDLEAAAARDEIISRPTGEYPFLAVEVQVSRGSDWSPSVTAYVARAGGRVVAVER